MLLYPEDVDRRLNWPLGCAEKFARRKRLPHVVLPDGSIRFDWCEIEPLLRHVGAEHQRKTLGRLIVESGGKLMRGNDPRLKQQEVHHADNDC